MRSVYEKRERSGDDPPCKKYQWTVYTTNGQNLANVSGVAQQHFRTNLHQHINSVITHIRSMCFSIKEEDISELSI